jgi:hypothetical protein
MLPNNARVTHVDPPLPSTSAFTIRVAWHNPCRRRPLHPPTRHSSHPPSHPPTHPPTPIHPPASPHPHTHPHTHLGEVGWGGWMGEVAWVGGWAGRWVGRRAWAGWVCEWVDGWVNGWVGGLVGGWKGVWKEFTTSWGSSPNQHSPMLEPGRPGMLKSN